MSPGLDFGDAGVAGEAGGDVDADAVGGVGGEVDRALDQVVAADCSQRHPRRAVPALHRERGNAVQGERHRIGRLDRIGVVVLDCVHDHVVDGLGAVEGDLHPVRPDIGRVVVPAAAHAPVSTGANVVDDCRYGIAGAVAARGGGHAAVAGQRDVDRTADGVDDLRQGRAGGSGIAGIAGIGGGDAVRGGGQRGGAAGGGPAVAAADQRYRAAA